MMATRKRTKKQPEVSVDEAKRIAAEAIQKENAAKVEAFKAELGQLCEKHGMSIQAIPTVVPAPR